MIYRIDNSQGQNITDINEKNSTVLAGLTLPGSGEINYGESLNENLVKLLEKFANTTPPVNGVIGQLWYDPETDVLQIKTISDNMASSWRAVGTPTVSPEPPTNPTVGDLWYNSTPRRGQLKIWVNNEWTLIGPNNLPDTGISGAFIDVIEGNTVIKILIDSITMAIVSGQQFDLSTPLEGFAVRMYPGLNLRTSNDPLFINFGKLEILQNQILPKLDIDVDIGTNSLRFGEIHAREFRGTMSGVTTVLNAITTTLSTNTQSVSVDLDSADVARYPIFYSETAGDIPTQVNSSITYQPNTNTLTVDEVVVDSVTSTASGIIDPLEVVSNTEIVNLRSQTASKWHTPRTWSFSGSVGVSGAPPTIDGSANVTVTTAINVDQVALGINTVGDYVNNIEQVPDNSIAVVGTGSENNVITVTNNGLRSLTAGAGITLNNSTGSVIVNSSGVISINDSFASVNIPIRSYTLSRPSSAVGTTTRSVYLIPGYWQLTLEVQAVATDTADHYFTMTQIASLDSATVSAGITFSKRQNPLNPGAGANRIYHGDQIGIGSLQVTVAGTYNMSIAAHTITGSPGGTLASGPNTILRAELISGDIVGDIGVVTVGTLARPPEPVYDPPDTGGGGTYDSCLAYGTMIAMADGTYKPVETLAVGDVVKSLDIDGLGQEENDHVNWITSTWNVEPATATVKSVKLGSWYRYCDINEGFLLLTNDHELLIQRDGEYRFMAAADIRVGDALYGIDGTWVLVFSHKRVYNILNFVDIDVEDEDVYFANGVLSHNFSSDGDPYGGK